MIRSLPRPALPPRVKKILVVSLLLAGGVAAGAALGIAIASPDYSAAAVTAVGVTFCLGVVLVDVKLGMLLWIVLSPYARFIPLDIVLGHGIPDLKLDRLITLLLLALWAAQVAIGRRKIAKVYWSDIFFALFALFTLFSYAGTGMSLRAILQVFWDIWLVPFVAYLMARQLFSGQQDIKRIGVALGIIGLYFGLLATQEQLTGVVLFYPENRSVIYTAHVRRVVNLLGNPAFIAAVLAMAAPFAARGVVEATRRGKRFIWTIALVVMAVGTFMCYNRTGWGAFILALLVMAPFYPKFRRAFLPIFIAAGVVLLATWGAATAIPEVRERLGATGPIEGRLAAYNVAFKMIEAHPLTGVGQGNYAKYYTLYSRGVESEYFDPNRRVDASPHNSWLDILTFGGFLAFMPYLLFLISALWLTLKFYVKVRDDTGRARALIAVTWGSFVGYFLPTMTSDMVAFPYTSILFLVVIGAVQGWILGEGQRLIPQQVPAEGDAP